MFKRILSIVIAISILIGVPAIGRDFYFATLEQDKNQAESELEGVNSEIEDIKGEQDELQVELSETAELLSELLADKQILEKDIAEKQAEIDETAIALEEAQRKEAEGYEAMVLRIQYMYQNSTLGSIWDAILNADGFIDLLNRIEYISKIYSTDRELMAEYAATVDEVKTLATNLDIEMNNLLTLQENLEHQQEELEVVMEELKEDMDSYEEQLAAAEAKAVELAAYIEEQNRLIREEEERRRKEEEEQRKKEEEEQRRKESEEEESRRKASEEEESRRKASEEEESRRKASEEEESRRKASEEESRRKEEEEASKSSSEPETNEPEATEPETSEPETTEPEPTEPETTETESEDDGDLEDVTGEDIVAYALKFVGNPYVWGGNSLTEGCDCSGFVNLIYKHFGFKDVPRQSQKFKKYGVAVDFADIQPGDIVVYPGHVAIYIGDGKIVEAQSSKVGITCNRSVTSGTITAIRRVIGYEERE